MAVNSVADALTSEGTSVFATDDDPQLVAEALPFALKTMESLLQTVPENRKLLIGTSAGFVQYSHAFVLRPAERLEKNDLVKAREQKYRAKKLFLRARDYGLKALNLKYSGFNDSLSQNPEKTLQMTKKQDIPALYWTGVAWISAISVDKGDLTLVADLPVVIQILERCMVLDESWDNGAIHEVFIPIDAGRSEAEGGGIESAKRHYNRALELNGGKSIGVKVLYAESICIPLQDRDNFELLLQEVLAFDANQHVEYRLVNILAQQKAQFLLENIEDYFI
jgi:predicted anti-sigma-YlaC factor YlaD